MSVASGVEESCVVEVSDNRNAAALLNKMERLFEANPKLAVAVASQVILKHLSEGSKG